MCKDGDFLVRDSISQPGDYVLTVRWSMSPLHFVINRQVAGEDSGGNPKISYQFEEQMFDRVAELVQYYIANKKQVSEMSGAVMLYPINRLQAVDPKLSYGHAPAFGLRVAPSFGGSKSAGPSPGRSPLTTPTHSPPALRRQKRSGSQPLIAHECGLDGEGGLERRGSLPPMTVVDIDTGEGGSKNGEARQKGPPPKPALSNAHRPVVTIRNRALYEDDGKDYSDYAQVKCWASAHRERQGKKNGQSQDSQGTDSEPEYDNNFGGQTGQFDESDYDVPRSNAPYIPQPQEQPEQNQQQQQQNGANNAAAMNLYDVPKNFHTPPKSGAHSGHLTLDLEEDGSSSDISPMAIPIRSLTSPNLDAESCFDYDVFSSGLIPKDNKPLDSGCIATMKGLLLGGDPRLLAQHLTYVDLEILKVMGQHDLGMGVFSGLELLTLPQGHRLRQDLIERWDMFTECHRLKFNLVSHM